MYFKVGDDVRTIVNPFDKNTEVRYGVVVYIHPKDTISPYIVDFGDTWGGFMENQLETDI